MDVVYFILLLAAAVLLLVDSFAGAVRSPGRTVGVRLLPLALFFWVLVPLIQVGKSL